MSEKEPTVLETLHNIEKVATERDNKQTDDIIKEIKMGNERLETCIREGLKPIGDFVALADKTVTSVGEQFTKAKAAAKKGFWNLIKAAAVTILGGGAGAAWFNGLFGG